MTADFDLLSVQILGTRHFHEGPTFPPQFEVVTVAGVRSAVMTRFVSELCESWRP